MAPEKAFDPGAHLGCERHGSRLEAYSNAAADHDSRIDVHQSVRDPTCHGPLAEPRLDDLKIGRRIKSHPVSAAL